MDIEELRARKDAEADELADQAEKTALGAIAGTTVAACKAALARVSKIVGSDSINTAAAELRALRTDPALLQVLDKDIAATVVWLRDRIPEWIAAGWLTQAEGQRDIIAAQSGLPIKVELTAENRANLADFPVQGSTAREIAEWQGSQLRRTIESDLGACSAAGTPPEALPAALLAAGQAHATRAAQAARASYFAGAQAADLDLGGTLTGKK